MSNSIPGLNDQYVYNATLVRVLDGDTARLKLWKAFNADWDFGFHIKEEINTIRSVEINCRLHGLNAPEIHGVTGTELKEGNDATLELKRLLGLGSITARTHKPDKYGRFLVELWVTDKDGAVTDVNSSLLAGGFAKPFMVNR
jgi:endonuclease YncB( thermonuclease family)